MQCGDVHPNPGPVKFCDIAPILTEETSTRGKKPFLIPMALATLTDYWDMYEVSDFLEKEVLIQIDQVCTTTKAPWRWKSTDLPELVPNKLWALVSTKNNIGENSGLTWLGQVLKVGPKCRILAPRSAIDANVEESAEGLDPRVTLIPQSRILVFYSGSHPDPSPPSPPSGAFERASDEACCFCGKSDPKGVVRDADTSGHWMCMYCTQRRPKPRLMACKGPHAPIPPQTPSPQPVLRAQDPPKLPVDSQKATVTAHKRARTPEIPINNSTERLSRSLTPPPQASPGRGRSRGGRSAGQRRAASASPPESRGGAPSFPQDLTWELIFTVECGTIRHIPKRVRSAWAEVIHLSDTWALKHNTPE